MLKQRLFLLIIALLRLSHWDRHFERLPFRHFQSRTTVAQATNVATTHTLPTYSNSHSGTRMVPTLLLAFARTDTECGW